MYERQGKCQQGVDIDLACFGLWYDSSDVAWCYMRGEEAGESKRRTMLVKRKCTDHGNNGRAWRIPASADSVTVLLA